MRIFLTGGWGYGNIGDDAILRAMLKSLSREFPDATLFVTSFSPQETRAHHSMTSHPSFHRVLATPSLGKLSLVAIILRFLLLFVWKAVWQRTGRHLLVSTELKALILEMARADVVVMGGGGYFNDVWLASFFSRLAEILVADALGKKVVIYGQTVGPFNSIISKLFFGHFINKVDAIAYRDVQSTSTLEQYKYDSKKAVETADEATLLPCSPSQRSLLSMIDPDKQILGVMIQAFRPYVSVSGVQSLSEIESESEYISRLTNALVELHEKQNLGIVFLPSTTWDRPYCEKVYKLLLSRLPSNRDTHLIEEVRVEQYVGLCQNVDFMLSTNMHPIILAATCSVPSVAISYFYKVDDFMQRIGMSDYTVRIDQIKSELLVAKVVCLMENRGEVTSRIENRFEGVKFLARRNVCLLRETVER